MNGGRPFAVLPTQDCILIYTMNKEKCDNGYWVGDLSHTISDFEVVFFQNN